MDADLVCLANFPRPNLKKKKAIFYQKKNFFKLAPACASDLVHSPGPTLRNKRQAHP